MYKLISTLLLSFGMSIFLFAAEDCNDETCTETHPQTITCEDENCTDNHSQDETCTDDHTTTACKDKTCTDDHSKIEKEQPLISDEALANYNVTLDSLMPTTFSPTLQIPAKIEQRSQSQTAISMMLPGTIKNIASLRLGMLICAQEKPILMTIERDPIAPPELAFVTPFLRPNPIELQQWINNYYTAKLELANRTAELKRLENLQKQSPGIISKTQLIELNNQINAAKILVQSNENSLLAFGYSTKELNGDQVIENHLSAPQWIRALKNQKYWNNYAQDIYKMVDSEVQNDYWFVAALGELAARNFCTDKLFSAVKNNVEFRKNIVNALSLLLQSHPLVKVEQMAQYGWLYSTVHLQLPEVYNHYVLQSIDVKAGGYYNVGEKILILSDLSTVELVARPLGTERALFSQAAKEDFSMFATPLLKNAGPIIRDLKIDRFETDAQGEKVLLSAKNELINHKFFLLRDQMDYVLHLPTEKQFEKVFIVPLDAVTDLGSDKVILLKKGKQFVPAKVIVLYQDSTNAILSSKSQFHARDIYVKTGAFRLNLALQKLGGQQTFDVHAGCSH